VFVGCCDYGEPRREVEDADVGGEAWRSARGLEADWVHCAADCRPPPGCVEGGMDYTGGRLQTLILAPADVQPAAGPRRPIPGTQSAQRHRLTRQRDACTGRWKRRSDGSMRCATHGGEDGRSRVGDYFGLYCGLCTERGRIPQQATALRALMAKEGLDRRTGGAGKDGVCVRRHTNPSVQRA
jgi:hypothetical protein